VWESGRGERAEWKQAACRASSIVFVFTPLLCKDSPFPLLPLEVCVCANRVPSRASMADLSMAKESGVRACQAGDEEPVAL
jgi:hypothetical protein